MAKKTTVKFNLTAAPGFAIVEPITETVSKGGIALPQNDRNITRGRVLSYSYKESKEDDENIGIHAGDIVHFGRVLHIIRQNEDTYFVLAQEDVLAIEDE